jgi:hypothetical protein
VDNRVKLSVSAISYALLAEASGKRRSAKVANNIVTK